MTEVWGQGEHSTPESELEPNIVRDTRANVGRGDVSSPGPLLTTDS